MALAVDLARAAPAQILLGDAEPVAGCGHERQSVQDLRILRAGEQEATRRLPCPSHAAAQLMQLRQAEALGVLDDDDRSSRNIHAHLQHGGGDQDIDLAGTKGLNHFLLISTRHLSVQQAHARRRQQRPQLAKAG